MARKAAILGIHLLDQQRGPIHVGTLTRDTSGAVTFAVAQPYIQDSARPILSLGWYDPLDDEATRERLSARGDKISLHGSLPPWFSGLLPEGALRDLVLTEMGPGDHGQFDVLARLGADLPGAIMVTPETELSTSAGPIDLTSVKGFKAVQPKGLVKFSLAGVQLKFAANLEGERLTMPGSGDSGRCIIKVASDRYPHLPEAEFGAMQLARLAGVNIAACRLMPRTSISGVPEELLAHGDQVLVVDRFDRGPDDSRIHIEDAAQIIGANGDRKYTMGTTETVINMIGRFSTDRRGDILEAIRRVVVDVLVGNGDNHLKNWSFIFPDLGTVRLSPAYDIVPTVMFMPRDTMALRFVRTHDFHAVNLHRFERVASFLRVDPKWILGEVRATVKKARDTWPAAAIELFGDTRAKTFLDRMESLPLVHESIT